jgi:hypothetical protein
MNTDELIERICEAPQPVRHRLSCPWNRTARWLAFALPYVTVMVLVVSPRSDLGAKLVEWRFVIELGAALFTGVIAAVAAFATTIPGLDRRFLLLPLLPLGVWLGSLSQGCLAAFIRFGPDGLALQPDWFSFAAIALVGAGPAVAMAFMLRRGAPLTPYLTTALGGLAAAGLGGFGLRFIHPQDASIMVLVWQVGTVMILSALAGTTGRYVMNWRALSPPRPVPGRGRDGYVRANP